MGLFRKNRRFYLRPELSPTYFNVAKTLQERGWKPTRYHFLAHFGEMQFQFNNEAAEQLEFKHLLAQLVAEYCPNIMPETYVVDDNNWALVLSQLAENHNDDLVWILKPSKLNNAQHIKIFTSINDIEAHFVNPRRLGGEQVLQRYIVNPDLLKDHKYSIRMFVIISSNKKVYLYPKGYLNVALSPYQPQDFTNLNAHLTNEHLQDEVANVVQIPTDRWDEFSEYYPQINSIITTITQALQEKHPQAFNDKNPTTLAIYGFDFLLDSNKHVWLLEANHGPCFPIEETHPLQKYLYHDFWQAFTHVFIEQKDAEPNFDIISR